MSAYNAAKELIKRASPTTVLQPQPANLWQGEFPLPPSVAEYFIEFGPVDIWIESYGNPYSFPSLSKLWDWQTGYRYHGITKDRIDDWDDDWLVIADQGGDPFILLRSSGAVLFAFHGEGSWSPSPMFKNLAHMTTTLATLGDIAATAGKAITDDEFIAKKRANAWPKHCSRIMKQRQFFPALVGDDDSNKSIASFGARLCAKHQPQHVHPFQPAAAGSATTATLQ